MPLPKDQLNKYSRGELEQFLNQLLENPIFKEHLCSVEAQIDGLRNAIMRGISLNSEMQNQENFDKGRYQGLSNLVDFIKEVRILIHKKDTK